MPGSVSGDLRIIQLPKHVEEQTKTNEPDLRNLIMQQSTLTSPQTSTCGHKTWHNKTTGISFVNLLIEQLKHPREPLQDPLGRDEYQVQTLGVKNKFKEAVRYIESLRTSSNSRSQEDNIRFLHDTLCQIIITQGTFDQTMQEIEDLIDEKTRTQYLEEATRLLVFEASQQKEKDFTKVFKFVDTREKCSDRFSANLTLIFHLIILQEHEKAALRLSLPLDEIKFNDFLVEGCDNSLRLFEEKLKLLKRDDRSLILFGMLTLIRNRLENPLFKS